MIYVVFPGKLDLILSQESRMPKTISRRLVVSSFQDARSFMVNQIGVEGYFFL